MTRRPFSHLSGGHACPQGCVCFRECWEPGPWVKRADLCLVTWLTCGGGLSAQALVSDWEGAIYRFKGQDLTPASLLSCLQLMSKAACSGPLWPYDSNFTFALVSYLLGKWIKKFSTHRAAVQAGLLKLRLILHNSLSTGKGYMWNTWESCACRNKARYIRIKCTNQGGGSF